MRQISLRRLLLVSLVTFTVLPTLVVIVLSFRQSYAAIDTLTQRMLDDVALRIQHETREHLNRPNAVMNALVEPNMPSDQARSLLANPLEFERMAFALTRQLADVPYLYYGTSQGDFLGVQRQAQGTRVGVRSATDIGRSNFMATSPGDRSNLVSKETQAYEPRTRPWYVIAEGRMERSYTDVYASASTRKLLVTLAQPILDRNGAVAAVLAADLSLDLLSDSLRRGRISENAVAYIVDDKGYLVATSSAEALYRLNVDLPQRITPLDSSNGLIAQSFLMLASQLGHTGLVAAHRAGGMAIADNANKDMVSITQPVGQALNLKWTLVVASPRSDFSQAVTASLNQVLLIVSVFLGLAGLLAWGFAGGLGRRLDRLGAAAKQLGRGEIPPDHHSSRILDVALLSRAMHDSGVQLLASREDIEAKAQALTLANETLEQRVTERTAQLEASREDALAAARAKASFLATMSHEIRTPLNGVVGMTTLLADTPLDTEQRDYLHTMRVSSDQLLGVINDILDFSKIESGKLDLENEPLNLQATIEEACDMAAQRAREKGLELLADIDADVPPWVLGDVTRLRQVLLNFINNAVKFTDNGQIVVSAHISPAHRGLVAAAAASSASSVMLEFRVEDSGIGIPLDRQSALFQSFSQVDASTTRKYGGTGLGLAICKRLATLMGGEVGVRSAPGAGSTFWFTASLQATSAPSYAPADDEFASLAGKRALLVDDTELNLRILEKQLKRWGMQTVVFDRAQAGLDWLADNSADFIVTDMHMPGMDGQEFTQKVRQRTPDAHVVLVTSGVMPTGPAAKLFDARLLKPYRQSQLFNALSRVATLPASSAFSGVGQAAKPLVPAKNQRILVADDNAINLKVALAMLAKLGYEAATATNGREAADMVSQSLSRRPGTVPFAAVLMDANMPVVDGFEATQLILATHRGAAPPLIALTASVLEEDRQRCMDAGMVGFLAKPLRIDELSEALARFAPEVSDAPNIVAASAYINSARGVFDVKNIDKSANDVLVLDTSRLDRFKEFDDEQRTMTREIVALFIEDAPQRVNAIRHALALLETSGLSRAVHALQGAAANVGATALADSCGNVEHACLQGLWPENAVASVDRIAQLTTQSVVALRQWLAVHS